MNPTWESECGTVKLWCGDCLEVMATWPDGAVDSVVTDPPYGIGLAANPVRQKFERKKWDACAPSSEALAACIAAAKEAIVWGGNYFALPPSKGWLVWDKQQPENFTLAMCELAWTNMDRPAKMFRKHPIGYEKFHPTQKPVDLMAWCIGFLPDAKTTLDPFMGSGTTGVAAVRLGRQFWGVELDPGYFEIAKRRIQDELRKVAFLEPTKTDMQREMFA